MSQISVLQSAILASKVNAPSVYDVNDMSNNYINRVKTNLEKMKQQNFISESQYQEAMSQLEIKRQTNKDDINILVLVYRSNTFINYLMMMLCQSFKTF